MALRKAARTRSEAVFRLPWSWSGRPQRKQDRPSADQGEKRARGDRDAVGPAGKGQDRPLESRNQKACGDGEADRQTEHGKESEPDGRTPRGRCGRADQQAQQRCRAGRDVEREQRSEQHGVFSFRSAPWNTGQAEAQTFAIAGNVDRADTDIEHPKADPHGLLETDEEAADEDSGDAEQASEDGANRHVCRGKPQSPFPIKFGCRPEEHGGGTDGAGFDEAQEAEASGQGESRNDVHCLS